MRKASNLALFLFVFFISSAIVLQVSRLNAQSSTKTLTILHTNDLQSRLLPFGPNRDYTPDVLGDDHTIGGIARMATLIHRLRQKAPESTLLIDGGDFMMGTLFHTIAREEAPELRLLHRLGYDAITLGNHELDFRPEGLAQIIQAAQRHHALPPLLLANARFSATDACDDELQKLFDEGAVRPYRIIEKNGLRLGVFGLIGKDAAEVSPFAAPLRFDDPIAAAKRTVKILKEEQRVDVILCASHGGVWRNEGSEQWAGEDVALAAAVPEIDVIVGGHSHTPLHEPIREGRTLILQAGSEGRYVGELVLRVTAQGLVAESYRLHAVNDDLPADTLVQAEVRRYIASLDRNVLAPKGYAFDQILAETDFDLTVREDNSNLGNLVSDAVQWSIARRQVSRSGNESIIAVESNGLLRDALLKGESGLLQASDLFRIVPLGLGTADDAAGYPLVSFYLTAAELKRAMEVSTSVYPLKGSSYYLQPAGLRFCFNPKRVIFDRVYEMELAAGGDFHPLDSSRLYKVGCNIYIATFIKLIGDFTYGLLRMTPKDSLGRPIADLKTALVDANPELPGVQELKEWQALLDYVCTFPDTDGDGIPNIPERYREPEARIVSTASFNPALLYRNATRVTWGATLGVLLVFASAFVCGAYFFRKKSGDRI
jgi:5'-nucleotidase